MAEHANSSAEELYRQMDSAVVQVFQFHAKSAFADVMKVQLDELKELIATANREANTRWENLEKTNRDMAARLDKVDRKLGILVADITRRVKSRKEVNKNDSRLLRELEVEDDGDSTSGIGSESETPAPDPPAPDPRKRKVPRARKPVQNTGLPAVPRANQRHNKIT